MTKGKLGFRHTEYEVTKRWLCGSHTTFCDDVNVLYQHCPVGKSLETGGLVSIWNVAGVTEELTSLFYFKLIWILSSHTRLVATLLDTQVHSYVDNSKLKVSRDHGNHGGAREHHEEGTEYQKQRSKEGLRTLANMEIWGAFWEKEVRKTTPRRKWGRGQEKMMS